MISTIRKSAATDILLVIIVGITVKLLFNNIEAVGWRYSSFPAFVVVILMTTWMLRRRQWKWQDVGLVFPTSLRGWFVTLIQAIIAMGVAVTVTVIVGKWVGQYFEVPPSSDGRFAGIQGHLPTYLFWILVALPIAVVSEELIFRGFLINRFESLLSGQAPIAKTSAISFVAIVFPALLFGFAHYYYRGLNGALKISAFAIVYGIFYLAYDRKLLPLIIGHAAWNTIGLTARYLEVPDEA